VTAHDDRILGSLEIRRRRRRERMGKQVTRQGKVACRGSRLGSCAMVVGWVEANALWIACMW
jgi:hypothetical protein